MIPWPGDGESDEEVRISEATFYNWRERCAGLMPSAVRRLRQFEEENAKLERLVADRPLLYTYLQAPARRAGRIEAADQADQRAAGAMATATFMSFCFGKAGRST